MMDDSGSDKNALVLSNNQSSSCSDNINNNNKIANNNNNDTNSDDNDDDEKNEEIITTTTIPTCKEEIEETAPAVTNMKTNYNYEGEDDDYYSAIGTDNNSNNNSNDNNNDTPDTEEGVDDNNKNMSLQDASQAAGTPAATSTITSTTKSCCEHKYCPWTACPTFVKTIPDTFPRITACIFGIFLPLLFLMVLSVICGNVLARLESPKEISLNDEILAETFLLQQLDWEEAIQKLVQLPRHCVHQFLTEVHNITVVDDENYTTTLEDIVDLVTVTSNTLEEDDLDEQGITNNASDYIVLYWEPILDLSESIQECTHDISILMDRILQVYDQIRTSGIYSKELTFDWIRCCNYTELGHQLTLRPTMEDIEAAKNQKIFYTEVWKQDQERLFQYYMQQQQQSNNSNGTIDTLDALTRSAEEATGKNWCHENASGVAWFWFTVMTTIGYGNQAPITPEGRIMVAFLGVVTILAFGGILATAGGIVGVFYEDIVARSGWTCLSRPLVAALVWALVTASWIALLAHVSFTWWQERWDPEYATETESIWFSFITTTTIGLGDFFLQPEVIFGQDLFVMTSLVLIGFVFLAAMLGQISEVISIFFPSYTHNWRRRVQKTNMFDMKLNKMAPSREVLELLDQATKLDQTLSRDETRDLQIIQDEETILRNLLERKMAQRSQMEARATTIQ